MSLKNNFSVPGKYCNKDVDELKREVKTREEMENYLNKSGWKQKEHPFTINGKETSMYMWVSPDNKITCSILPAYVQQSINDEERDRKAKIRKQKVDVKCNACGESLMKMHEDIKIGYYGLVDAEFSTGYESDPLKDGLMYRFSMCEKCLDKMFKEFKIKPEVRSYM